MNARTELNALFEEWRRLSEAEGEAIQAGAWEKVNDCQTAKYDLRNRMASLAENCRMNGGEDMSFDTTIEASVSELMELEARNSVWLGLKREEAQRERAEVNGSSRNLRMIQKSYVIQRESNWQTHG